MPATTHPGISLRGIAAAVPQERLGLADLIPRFGRESAEKLIASSGVHFHHRIREGQTTGDLCELAARTLLKELEWEPQSLDALLMVSQTFDHFTPATSCILHGKLGLSKQAATFDVGLGCSGWIYGVWLAATLIQTGCRRVLVLAGDTASKTISPFDNFEALVGDAGTATAVETDPHGSLHCITGSDGAGWKGLWVPAGAFRQRSSEATKQYVVGEDGVKRTPEHTHMNGPDIFSFTIREVPPLVERTLALAGWGKEQVDAFVLHQANKFINDYLVKRMKLSPEKVPISLDDFGNTSSASIPLTIQHRLRDRVSKGPLRLLMAGFGVGLSWGAIASEVGPLVIPDIQYLP